jgi:hypothetical protein
MPIFARTKLLISDDCMKPPGAAALTLKYSGPNPQNIYEKAKEIATTIWALEPGAIQEKEVNWDRTGMGEKFTVRIEITKDLDLFSFMLIRMDIDGEAKPSRQFGKEGNVSVKVESIIRTEYPQDTLWQKSLFYEFFRVLYHRLIYEETRKKYLQECKENTIRFQEELKSFLNLLPKIK